MTDEPDEYRGCYACEYFYKGYPGSFINPPEPPECDELPNVVWLPNWPFVNGCKRFKSKYCPECGHHMRRAKPGNLNVRYCPNEACGFADRVKQVK